MRALSDRCRCLPPLGRNRPLTVVIEPSLLHLPDRPALDVAHALRSGAQPVSQVGERHRVIVETEPALYYQPLDGTERPQEPEEVLPLLRLQQGRLRLRRV